MRYFEKSSVYDSDWDSVTSAFWIKYPNDKSKHVKSVDTIARHIDEEKGIIRLRRIMALEYCMPEWMVRIFGIPMHGLALEEATVDNKNRILELRSYNLGLCRFLQSEEICRYSQHPDDKSKTLYETKLSVTVKKAGYMQGILENQFLVQAGKKFEGGLEVMREKISEAKSLYTHPGGLYGRHYWNEILQDMKSRAAEKAAKLKCKKDEAKETWSDTVAGARISLQKSKEEAKEKLHKSKEDAKEKFSTVRMKFERKCSGMNDASKNSLSSSTASVITSDSRLNSEISNPISPSDSLTGSGGNVTGAISNISAIGYISGAATASSHNVNDNISKSTNNANTIPAFEQTALPSYTSIWRGIRNWIPKIT